MEKSMSVGVIERRPKEMAQSITSNPRGQKYLLESQRGWWQLKTPKMMDFLEEGRIRQRRVNRGSKDVNEKEEDLFGETLTPT